VSSVGSFFSCIQIEIYYCVISAACYIFRSPIVAIFREVFFEGILQSMIKKSAENMYTSYLMTNNQQVHIQIEIYYCVFSVACYIFRPPIVAIFREVFFEGILQSMIKKSIEYKM